MRPDNAAALVGAGLLTVIILPMAARLIPHRAVDVLSDATAEIVPATE
jgi:hypothetical protein